LEFRQPTNILFVDFKAAFDSINRGALWQILEHYGIPQKMITMMKALYENTKCTEQVNGLQSDSFDVNTGVRQGAIASPVLFNFAIDWVMKKAVAKCHLDNRKIGISLGDREITDLDYADDIALLADNANDLQYFVDQVVFFGSMLGLHINPDKSKILTVCSQPSRILIQGVEIENVRSFRYLGSLISADNSCEQEVLSRMCLAQSAFQKLNKCLFSRIDISISTKVRVYMASVRTILLYGSESWVLTSSLSSMLNSCEMRFLRQMVGIISFPYPSNDEVRRLCHIVESVSQAVKRNRLRWLGHVLRMDSGRIARRVLFDNQPADWKRPRCRPRISWDRIIHSETRTLTNIVRNSYGSFSDWSVDGRMWLSHLSDIAACRNQWRQIVYDLSLVV
jgi:hypothetical protein